MRVSKHRTLFLALAGLLLGFGTNRQANADIVGDEFMVANTFEDSEITGGLETIFGLDSATVIDPGVDISSFIGFYDIDFDETSLTMTLVDNSGASDLILPDGRFDRYYYGFDSNFIDSVELDGTEELNEFATLTLLDPGFELDVADLFGTGIPMPVVFENGGFMIEFGAGTDLTNEGVTARVNFESSAVPEPAHGALLLSACAVGIVAFRRFRNKPKQ